MNKRQLGRAFTKKVIAALKQIDPACYEVVGSGAGKDKGDLRAPRFDLVGECKDHGKVSMPDWVKQAEKEGLGYSKTALFWRHPKSPRTNPEIRVDISLDYFIELLSRAGEPLIKREDREFKYKIQRFVSAGKEILKQFN